MYAYVHTMTTLAPAVCGVGRSRIVGNLMLSWSTNPGPLENKCKHRVRALSDPYLRSLSDVLLRGRL